VWIINIIIVLIIIIIIIIIAVIVIVIDNRDNCDNVGCDVLNWNRHVLVTGNVIRLFFVVQ